MTAAHTSVLAWLESRVAEQPWRMAGGAFLLGAWVGAHPRDAPRGRLTRAAFAMLGTLALRVVRELAFRELAERVARPDPER